MKRLNKKGFTLVELLAAIVILAVLMLVGAQAIGTIMNNAKANSLVRSLDTAMKQAQMKYASAGALDTDDKLLGYLDYKEKEYGIAANATVDPVSGQIQYIVQLTVPEKSSFANVRCTHGDLANMGTTYSDDEDKKFKDYTCNKGAGNRVIITKKDIK